MKRSAAPVEASALVAASQEGLPQEAHALARARAFAEPLIAGELLSSGENTFAHADAVADILKGMGASDAMQAASYLVYAANHLARPQASIAGAFGDTYAALAIETNKLVQVQQQARQAKGGAQLGGDSQQQAESARKMLLAFSRDLRVVMLRLASRLQSLRYYAASKAPVPPDVARESLQVFAPLANRLGVWQIKWEIEDLAFRFLEPHTYQQIARLLDEKRTEREAYLENLRAQLQQQLGQNGIHAQVQGRPKHIYSIVKKMRGKGLTFERVFDVRAMRVIVPTQTDCYDALAWVHTHFSPEANEFDDYIAKPKTNGYQSLHTVVRDESVVGKGRAIEIQIRTAAMHEHAEHGVAAHWAYKEAGTKGYAGVTAAGAYDAKLAVLRQLLAWERDLSGASLQTNQLTDRIYVMTPEAAVVELPQGATAIDFAYTVHTNLGHRCRGAKVDGALVTLSTPLKNGQTIEITAAKEGGPSRDWLNPDLGFLASSRAKSKVRGWFNALAQLDTIAKGREQVEKLLQRLGKTATKLDDLAAQLGFKSADVLFETVGKDELSLKAIEGVFAPPPALLPADEFLLFKKAKQGEKAGKRAAGSPSGVLVVGVDSLLTQLAKCCKPAPPDSIAGFVTRGKGVSIHRGDCSNFVHMASIAPDRVIEVTWGHSGSGVYPVDVSVQAQDRQGLLRDISEVFSKEKFNVIGVQTQTVKTSGTPTAWMTFTVEVSDSGRLGRVMGLVQAVAGVQSIRRR